MPGEPTIQLNKIEKRYRKAIEPTVKDLSLNIHRGEIFGLLGPNGAGKTTTISMICGLFAPSSGTIFIENHNVQNDFESVKRLIGVVPQDIALFDTLSARENLRFFGEMYGIPAAELNKKIDHWLHHFGLDTQLSKHIKYFSGGMKRRINLIAALLHDPKILILDEPTVGVDVQSRHVIIKFLRELNQQGVTILYTSHLLEEAQELCTRVAIIDQGKILAKGTPDELIKSKPNVTNLQGFFLNLTGEKLRN